MEKSREAPIGHVIVFGEVVSAKRSDGLVRGEVPNDLHLLLEALLPGDHLLPSFHYNRSAFFQNGLVSGAIASLAENLHGSSEQIFQVILVSASLEEQFLQSARNPRRNVQFLLRFVRSISSILPAIKSLRIFL